MNLSKFVLQDYVPQKSKSHIPSTDNCDRIMRVCNHSKQHTKCRYLDNERGVSLEGMLYKNPTAIKANKTRLCHIDDK